MIDQNNTLMIEQAILGVAIRDGYALAEIEGELCIEHFSAIAHKAIFRAMERLQRKDIPLDLFTVKTELEQSQELLAIGGLEYLALLAKSYGAKANIAAYVRILNKRLLSLNIEEMAVELVDVAKNCDAFTEAEVVSKVEGLVAALKVNGGKRIDAISITDALAKVIDDMAQEESQAISTGYVELDKLLAGGMRPGEVFVVGATPGMGKSCFGMGIASHVAYGLNKSALIFSLEMDEITLGYRTVAMTSKIPINKLMDYPSKKFNEHDWSLLTQATGKLSYGKLYFDCDPYLTIDDIRVRAKRAKRRYPDLAVIVIDYIGLISTEGKQENRNVEIAKISRGLKILAKELNLPIVALSQLNRRIQERQEKRPLLSDLRDSGSVEQDADVVIFITRTSDQENLYNTQGLSTIYVEKNRRGPTSEFKLLFNGAISSFINYR